MHAYDTSILSILGILGGEKREDFPGLAGQAAKPIIMLIIIATATIIVVNDEDQAK